MPKHIVLVLRAFTLTFTSVGEDVLSSYLFPVCLHKVSSMKAGDDWEHTLGHNGIGAGLKCVSTSKEEKLRRDRKEETFFLMVLCFVLQTVSQSYSNLMKCKISHIWALWMSTVTCSVTAAVKHLFCCIDSLGQLKLQHQYSWLDIMKKIFIMRLVRHGRRFPPKVVYAPTL